MLSLDTRERRSTIWSITHASPGSVSLRPALHENFSHISYGLFALLLSPATFLLAPRALPYYTISVVIFLCAYALLTIPLQRLRMFYPPTDPSTLHVRGTTLFLFPVRRRLRNPASLILRPELLYKGARSWTAPKGYLWICSILSDSPQFDLTLSHGPPDSPNPSLPPDAKFAAHTLAQSLHLPPPQLRRARF
jgi:hypothetical protein